MAKGRTAIYTPLDRARKQIRLLEIISVEPQFTFKLHVASLLDKPVFSALSYVWGYPPLFADVIVDGVAVSVTQNLIDAVTDIYRHETRSTPGQLSGPRMLWADAICINQEDVAEKNFQVPLMREIYSGAEQVLSWQGKVDETTGAAFSSLHLIHEKIATLNEDSLTNLDWIGDYRELCHGYPGDPRGPWLGILRLMHRSYWNRIWIFQEVYLARDLLLISGSNVLGFAQLRSIQNWHDKAILGQQHAPDYFAPSTWAYLQTHRSMFESISAIEEARAITNAGKVNQRSIRGILSSTMDDDALVFYNQVETHALLLWIMGGNLESTDPKDSIYALMGISGLPLEPDYTPEVSAAVVYMGFLGLWEHCCSKLHPHYPDNVKSGILDLWFLIFAGVEPQNKAQPTLNLPSWVPNFPAISARYESGPSCSTSAMNQFPVGDYIFDGIDEQWHIDRRSLYCPAVKIDRVRRCGPVINVLDEGLVSWILECLTEQPIYPTGYHSAIAMLRGLISDYMEEEIDHISLPTVIDAYYYTCVLLIWNRRFGKASGESEAAEARMAPLVRSLLLSIGRESECQTFWERLPEWADDGDINEVEESPEKAPLLDVRRRNEARDRLELALSTSGGDMIAQTEKGYIGRFPAHVRESDLICLFKGYDGPVVLREVEDYHVFVGSSFIVEPLGGRTQAEMKALTAGVEVIEMR